MSVHRGRTPQEYQAWVQQSGRELIIIAAIIRSIGIKTRSDELLLYASRVKSIGFGLDEPYKSPVATQGQSK